MYMLRKLIVVSVFLLVAVLPIVSQSNEMIDKLLDEQKARFGLSAYLVLAASGKIPEEASVEDAMEALDNRSFSSLKKKTKDDFITFRELAYLVMQAFEMRGGIMYRIVPSPRYAYKEMLFINLLNANQKDRAPINSDEMIDLLSGVMEWRDMYR